jgi:glycine/serine hydroxymethyltransferase
MIKVTVAGKDVPLDHSRTLAQSGIRAGATLKLKSAGLLGGMQRSCAGGIARMFGGTEAAENRTLRERVRALEQQLLIH